MRKSIILISESKIKIAFSKYNKYIYLWWWLLIQNNDSVSSSFVVAPNFNQTIFVIAFCNKFDFQIINSISLRSVIAKQRFNCKQKYFFFSRELYNRSFY